MTVVLKCAGLAGRIPEGMEPPTGQYLLYYVPEAHDGMGDARFTKDVRKAMQFSTLETAMACWQAVPTNRPTRRDGQANRPLTAFHMEFEMYEEEATG